MIYLAGQSIVPRHGGLPKTMRMFAKALDAQIVSFTSPRLPDTERKAFPEVNHLLSPANPLLDWYGYVSRSGRKGTEQRIVNAELLSCHTMLRYHAHWVRRMAKLHHIPYWFVPHGQLDPYVYTYRAGIKHLWLKLFGRQLLREAAFVIFSTEQERKKAAWFYEGDNTRVVHWPVELIDTLLKAQAGTELRYQLGLPQDSRLLLYFGRLHSMKRPLETLEIFAKSNQSNLHLLLVGPDGDVSRTQCIEKAQRLGIANKVHVTGPVYGADKEKFLLGSDAFISLSHRENFGHTAAESLSAGTPVILSPGNDLSPELKPYQCGWFLKTDEEAEATSVLQTLAETPNETLLEMGRRGREFIDKECSYELFQQKLLALIDEAIAKHLEK